MRDTNLLLTDSAVAADAMASEALHLDGTPAEGVWLQFAITRNDDDTDETLDITVYGKSADSSWTTGDDPVAILDQVANGDVADGATIIRYLLVQTKHNYVKPYYNVGGTTPSWTIVCAVVSGPDQSKTAALA